MRLSIQQVGKLGVIKDLPNHLLPLAAWTDSSNVRFIDKKIARVGGTQAVFGTPTQAPHFLIPVQTPSATFWVYTSLTDAFVYDGSSHTEITRIASDYAANAGRYWNGGIFGGILVLTDEVDVPQYWPTISAATKLIDLVNWPATLRCRLIRPFKAFLVALNLTDSSVTKPHRVRWSDTAAPGNIPSSWDISDPTKDAGEQDLTDASAGEIKEAMILGDSLMIYKENSTWAMRFIGGSDLFKFDNVLISSGILAARCVCPIKQGQAHFLHNGDELIEFTGESVRAVTDDKWKRFLRADLDTASYVNAFCFALHQYNEAWFCYPSVGNTFPNRALIWNYEEDTLYAREFSGRAAALGPIPTGLSGTVWNSATGTWDAYEGTWDSVFGSAGGQGELVAVADTANTRFYMLESGTTFINENFSSYVEKLGMSFTNVDRFGNPVVDIGSRKMLKRLWPKIQGGPVQIRFAKQENLQAPIVYETPIVFDPANGDEYVDSVVNGRLVGFRIEEVEGNDWSCEGYEMELETLGEH